jgi:hypothetical protein
MVRRLVLSIGLLMLAVPLAAGITYEFKSSTAGRGGATLAGTTAIEGNNVRIEFASGDNLVFQSGSMLISRDGGKTFLVLDPKSKNYYEFSLEDLMKTAGNVLKAMGGMVQMSVTNQNVDVREAGAGETIEGYPTRKYLVNSSYDLSMKLLGSTTNSKVETSAESWVTDKIPAEYMTFVHQKGLKSGFDDLDKLIDAQAGKIKGFILRQVMTTRTSSGKKTDSAVTTTTVSGVKTGPVPATQFEVPDGYTQIESPMMRLINP